MSATEPEFSPEDYEGLQPKLTQLHPAELRKLRKQAQKSDELEARIAEMERREVFVKAGVPLDDPATEYLIRGYSGELTAEAIRAEAVRLRIIQSSAPTAEEMAGHNAAAAAAAGGQAPSLSPDFSAQLAEMSRKTFAPADEVAREQHIQNIARLARESGIRIPLS